MARVELQRLPAILLAILLVGVVGAACDPPPPALRVEGGGDAAVIGEGGDDPPSLVRVAGSELELPDAGPVADDDAGPTEPPPDAGGAPDAGTEEPPQPAQPSCDASAVGGDYCAGDKVSYGVEGTLYRCAGPGPATVVRACAQGCVVAPPGHDDY